MAVRKQRLDKYYNLAKEKGYRARSAFKLLELNKKYNFLADAHIAVDLCAAPGGWMQILAQEMPSPRKIIGIDLDPIKYLGSDTLSFMGDITTVECRRTLIRHLEGHQVDVFVHDGAPNFGTSKERDMFVQNDLVLHALKLATEFLKEGGCFVTKVFRSENFFKITKVLQELFEAVDVTKPLSSRQESAEIFVVCRRFKNPEEVNPSVIKGKYDIPVLDDLVEENEIEEKEGPVILTVEEKINEIRSKLDKKGKSKKIKGLSNITMARDGFFDDRIFEEFDSKEDEQGDDVIPEETQEISEDTYSDDIELTCDRRVATLNEFNTIPKKVREYLGRKRGRAARRANKVIKEVEVENEEEEA
ncbi:uncharacterized protein LOC143922121, partial [Arctopsyche grandis]|uniref:uncharacterized protein LOC143922121 n=1 Tax=Arctopsyche grandis TaxID=121162 RepID=UPI00406D9C2B